MTFDWRRPLIYTHRWLGIVGGVLFFIWFGSGIVMMYARMPSLSNSERLARLPAIDLTRAVVDPFDAARTAGVTPEACRLTMLGDRPVYRFFGGGRAATVFADTGEELTDITPEMALTVARPFADAAQASNVRLEEVLDDADQWTFSVRRSVPLYRIALDTTGDAFLYVSGRTGDAVMKTRRLDRRWGYFGAVLHWLYFTPFRRQAAVWAQSIIALSVAGCVLSLSGLLWGIWRYASLPRYRLKGVPSRTPYAGLMRWHHYCGLIFGLATFTWIFSGLLSMDPLAWSPDTSPSGEQRDGVAGGPIRLELLSAAGLREAVSAYGSPLDVREIDLAQFQGALFLAAARVSTEPEAAPRVERQLLQPLSDDPRPFSRFPNGVVEAAARAAMPGVAVRSQEWLEDYDAYYYDRDRERPLPVLRVRYADAVQTWLYLDPQSGEIVQKEERLSRLNRWLYHGLHSLDFPFLYYRRPLWDVVVIVLSLGGIVLSLTTMPVGWHRLRRHAQRLRRPTAVAAGTSGGSPDGM